MLCIISNKFSKNNLENRYIFQDLLCLGKLNLIHNRLCLLHIFLLLLFVFDIMVDFQTHLGHGDEVTVCSHLALKNPPWSSLPLLLGRLLSGHRIRHCCYLAG